MKAKELIKELKERIDKYGNCEVVVEVKEEYPLVKYKLTQGITTIGVNVVTEKYFPTPDGDKKTTRIVGFNREGVQGTHNVFELW